MNDGEDEMDNDVSQFNGRSRKHVEDEDEEDEDGHKSTHSEHDGGRWSSSSLSSPSPNKDQWKMQCTFCGHCSTTPNDFEQHIKEHLQAAAADPDSTDDQLQSSLSSITTSTNKKNVADVST